MNVFQPYALATSAYLTLQSLPLLLTPNLLITLCTSEARRITDLETYLARSLALALLALAAQTVQLTGILPVSRTSEASSEEAQPQQLAPYAKPTLIITTVYHALTGFYLYAQLAYAWNFAFTAGLTVSGGLFCVGLWVVLFGGERGRISRTTGADKRTGNFPFENKESAREKRKEEKEKDGKGKRRSVLRSGSFK